MKNLLKLILSITIILTNVISNAQTTESKQGIENTIYVGYIPHMVLDVPNFGLHLGYNVTFPLSKRFAAEAQASYSLAVFKGPAGTFEEEEGNIQILNLLGGGRFYFSKKEDNKANVYVNALFGWSYLSQKKKQNKNINTGSSTSSYQDLGYSIGLYRLMNNNISFGVALETDAAVTIKVGYSF